MEVVGETPIGHLTANRMYLASDELTRGRRTLIEIAEKVGYNSGKAFARAIHRWSGTAPRRYARNAHPLDDLAKRG
jgi:methylphosphotriester-DNA--protein-cysteine methyltransferase